MTISNLKATNMELTDAIREYVEKRLSQLDKLLQGHRDMHLSVEVGKTTRHHKEGDFFFAEVNLVLGGENFRAVSERDNLYTAIDEVKDELARELTHFKDRRRTLIRRGSLAIKNTLKGLGNMSGKMKFWRRFRK